VLEQAERRVEGHRPVEAIGQGYALDQLHDDEGDSVVVAVIEDLEDVRMPEACDRPCLLLKALAVRRIVGEELVPHLDCDVAIVRRMVRTMYGWHTTSADSVDQSSAVSD